MHVDFSVMLQFNIILYYTVKKSPIRAVRYNLILSVSHNDFICHLLIEAKILWKNQGLYDNFWTILS